MNAYLTLCDVFKKLNHLNHLEALATWDEATMMPSGGGQARAGALATLSGLQHQLLTHPSNGELIDSAKTDTALDALQQRNLYWMARQYDQATCLPEKLVTEITEKSTLCEQAWRHDREHNDWQAFYPKLNALFELIKESAVMRSERFNLAPYDVLIDEYSPGFSQAMIDPIFEKLKTVLPDKINQIMAHQASIKLTKIDGHFEIEKQRALGIEVMRHIGFDFKRGRLDVSHHPFCGGVAEDVRLTTRYREHEFLSSLMGICHETGHACYEQGLPQSRLNQPVGLALGMSVHESQSLLIEMPVCRSPEFLQFITPLILKKFGEHDGINADNLYHTITRVEKSLIRVDADEVTYPLHVILRYEIERDLFSGQLALKDLPDAWDDKMQTYLGLSTKGNDKDGVMQDVHWPSGAFGYFPAYTLGRLMAQQFYTAALKSAPDIPEKISQGDFSGLMQWLRQHVHEKGSSLTTDDLLKQATGESLNPDYFLQHLSQYDK